MAAEPTGINFSLKLRVERTAFSFIVIIAVAIATAIFIANKASEAVSEIDSIQNTRESYMRSLDGTPKQGGEIDTSTWKTYRNEKYGFEVRYPFDWIIVPDDRPGDDHVSFGPTKLIRSLIWLGVVKKSEFEKGYMFADTPILEKKEQSIAGIKAERFVYQPFKSLPETVVILKKEDQVFSIGAAEGGEEEHVIEIFDHILSTFKFIK